MPKVKRVSDLMPTKGGKGVIALAIVWLAVDAQVPAARIVHALREQQMYLVNLWNDGYRIAFPEEPNARVTYQGHSVYLFSIIAPNGRSLFGVRRMFDEDGRTPPVDTLLRRGLDGPVAREEIVSSPFINMFQYAVSPNERFMLIAGRLRESGVAKGQQRDGIFLFNRASSGIQYIAPVPGAGLNESIRSLNVGDRGEVVYEDAGTIIRSTDPDGHLIVSERHPGQFPALMPIGQTYVYSDRGWLVQHDGKAKHQLLRVPKIVGAIRVSPDGRFVAFGMDEIRLSGMTQLRICELESRTCVDGPKYSDFVAGRETFWLKR
jgi:hypothetical protein